MPTNEQLAKTLHGMVVVDQRFRKKAMRTRTWDTKVDKIHTRRMKQIIKRYGWPTANLVGKKGNFDAWLLIQHADHDVPFQKHCLALMKKAAKENPKDVVLKHIALLTDRILIKETGKQLYGTQFIFKDGKYGPWPIRDRKNLDARRKRYGLPPFREYERKMRSDPFTKKAIAKMRVLQKASQKKGK